MANQKSTDSLTENLNKLSLQIEEEVKNSITELPPENRFITLQMAKDRAALEVREGLHRLQEMLDKGLKAIIDALTALKKDAEQEAILNWFDNNIDQINDFLNVDESALESKTPEEILNFPRENLISMHEAATYLLQQKKYNEALSAMALCLQFNPTLAPLWFTYGSILQEMNEHEAALYVFQMAAVLDDTNPYTLLHMARCWIAINQWDEAKECLEEAKKLCHAFPEYTDLLTYCTELEEWMKKNKKEEPKADQQNKEGNEKQ